MGSIQDIINILNPGFGEYRRGQAAAHAGGTFGRAYEYVPRRLQPGTYSPIGIAPRVPDGCSMGMPCWDIWKKNMDKWWTDTKLGYGQTPGTPKIPDPDLDWLDKLKRGINQTFNDWIDEMTPNTKTLGPRAGGILALASTAIDWIAFLVECSVFETFLYEEACQVEIMHTYQYMCPELKISDLIFSTNTYLKFMVMSGVNAYITNAWTLAYTKSGYRAYFNAALIFLDACRLVCNMEPFDITLK